MRFIKKGKKNKHKQARARSKRASNAPPRAAGRQHLAIAGMLVASTAITAGASARAGAQSTAPSSTPPSETDQPSRSDLPSVHLSIPAGPLDSALAGFIRATGVTVHTSASAVRGLHSSGVAGVYTPRHALEILLQETPLSYRFTNARTVVIENNSAARTSLSAVSIIATANHAHPTSPKYTEPLRDTPQSLIVIPQTVIKAQGATTLRDVLRNVPGITINAGEGGATPGDNFNVRGFSARSDMYVDGVRDEGGYTRDAFNFDQVEVAEGPASVYNGRGSTGGSINMATKTPTMRQDRTVMLTGGSADRRRATADVNQPLDVAGIPGAAVRLNALWNDGGVPGNDVVENRGWGIAPSLAVGLNSATTLKLSYLKTAQDNIPAYGLEDFNGTPHVDTRNFFGLNGLDFERVDADNVTAKIEHQFSGSLRLVQQMTRGHSETGRIVTYTRVTDGSRSAKSHVTNDDVIDSQTNLTANIVTGVIRHDIVTGVELSREKSMFGHYTVDGALPVVTDLNNPQTPAGFNPRVTVTPFPRIVTANSLGAYAFDTMKLGEQWELSAGLRWDRFSPEYSDSVSHPVASADAASGRIGVVYKPMEAGSVYAAYGNSFNPSIQNLAYDNLTGSNLQPESNHTIEVGTKWEMFKRRLLASWAFFRTDKVNARTADPTDLAITILDGNQRVQGMEVHATGSITPAWNVLAGYSYMESKYLKSGTASQVGMPLNDVPRHSVNVWTTYQLPGHLEIGGGTQYVDRRLLSASKGTAWVPSYHVYNAEVAYHFANRLDLRLNIDNLTNALYYDNGRFWVPAPSRSVLLSTTAHF
jgi:catecholate siderophore receptor